MVRHERMGHIGFADFIWFPEVTVRLLDATHAISTRALFEGFVGESDPGMTAGKREKARLLERRN